MDEGGVANGTRRKLMHGEAWNRMLPKFTSLLSV